MAEPPYAPITPPGRWERLAQAAARLGVSPDVLLSEVETRPGVVRMQRLGRRGLVHLAADDVDRLRVHLGMGVVR